MVSVIIPTLNEEARVAEVVKFCFKSPLVREVIVIDDGSTDRTVENAEKEGAKVFYSSMLGKGASMYDGLWRAQEDCVLYLDGDIFNFAEDLVELMVEPLLSNKCDFTKGKFQRQAGRVTILTALPLIKTFFPELAHISQPLGGIVAARKDLLKNIKFEPDYGVDIGLLIDVGQLGARIQEVDIGSLDHDHQTLERLGDMSMQVTRAILERASRYRKMDVLHIKDSFEIQRVHQLQGETILAKIDPKKKLALFDMDGTLLEGRYIERLARYANRQDELARLIDSPNMDAIERTRAIAKILAGLPKAVFEKIAMIAPLAPMAQEVIVELKKRGFTIGIITDSYFVASEIVRKRVFADFSIAHLLNFRKGLFTGEMELSPLMRISHGCQDHTFCKVNFLEHLKEMFSSSHFSNIHFVGDGLNDVCLLKASNSSVAINPKHHLVSHSAQHQISHLEELLGLWK